MFGFKKKVKEETININKENEEANKMGKFRLDGKGNMVRNTDEQQKPVINNVAQPQQFQPQGFNDKKVFGVEQNNNIETPKDIPLDEQIDIQDSNMEEESDRETYERMIEQEARDFEQRSIAQIREQQTRQSAPIQQPQYEQPQQQVEDSYITYIIACVDGITYTFVTLQSVSADVLNVLKENMEQGNVILLNNMLIDCKKIIGISQSEQQ